MSMHTSSRTHTHSDASPTRSHAIKHTRAHANTQTNTAHSMSPHPNVHTINLHFTSLRCSSLRAKHTEELGREYANTHLTQRTPEKCVIRKIRRTPPGGCLYGFCNFFFPREKIDLSQQAATWEAEILKKGQSLQYLWRWNDT